MQRLLPEACARALVGSSEPWQSMRSFVFSFLFHTWEDWSPRAPKKVASLEFEWVSVSVSCFGPRSFGRGRAVCAGQEGYRRRATFERSAV